MEYQLGSLAASSFRLVVIVPVSFVTIPLHSYKLKVKTVSKVEHKLCVPPLTQFSLRQAICWITSKIK